MVSAVEAVFGVDVPFVGELSVAEDFAAVAYMVTDDFVDDPSFTGDIAGIGAITVIDLISGFVIVTLDVVHG